MDQATGRLTAAVGEGSPGVQPRVSEADVAEFAGTASARHLERLDADQTIMLRLSAEGFGGSEWEAVAGALVEYGWSVMRAWIVTGRVFVRCREKGLGGDELAPPVDGLARDDALELADETVAEALVNFRDHVLAAGRWDASRGASLTTFFVGNCLLRFVNVYRKWGAARRREILTYKAGFDLVDFDDPATVVTANERVVELLAREHDLLNRAIVQLTADNYGVDEIAELVGMSSKQVESRLYRTRKRLGRAGGTAA